MKWKTTLGLLIALAACGVGTFGQDAAYEFSGGLDAWGLVSGMGLVGVSAEAEQDGLGLGALLGIGTNRVQGWGLWPRAYLGGEAWRPFGELALVQLSETEIQVDPERGLIANTYTWQFMGVGLGAVYRQDDRHLRASLGMGVTGGQCAVCGLLAYATVQIGFSF